jgi:ribosome-associated protein
LARELVGLSEKKLAGLALPPEILEGVLEAKRIRSPIALNRQLRVVRRELRSGDAAGVRAKVDAVLRPDGTRDWNRRAAVVWADRLVAEGDVALEELASEYPSADRRRLRQLTRNVKQASEKRVAPAREALVRALAEAFSRRPSATPE